MKKIIIAVLMLVLSNVLFAQKNKPAKNDKSWKEGKEWNKEKVKKEKDDDDDMDDDKGKNDKEERKWKKDNKENEDRENASNSKSKHKDGKHLESKNIPDKVKDAFNSEFPNAKNVTWTKSKGKWTATFSNDLFSKTVSYNANGSKL